MADPKTLIELATLERQNRRDAQASVTEALADAREALRQAREAVADATEARTAASADAARLRRQLGSIVMPADGEPLLAELADAIAEERAAAASLTEAELERTEAMSSVERLTEGLQHASALRQAAEADLLAVQNRITARDAAIESAKTGAASGSKQAATDALASADYTAAKNRVKGYLPTVLYNRARERFDAAKGAATRAAQIAEASATEFANALQQSGLPEDKLPALERAYNLAEGKLLDYAAGAVTAVASATATLTRLAQPGLAPVLSAEQRAEIEDAGALARRQAAVAAEAARDTALQTLAEKEALLEIERIKVLAANPDADLDTLDDDPNTPLGDAAVKWQQAHAAYAAADEAFSVTPLEPAPAPPLTHREVLLDWQAAVPEAVWSELDAFWNAEDVLGRYKALAINPLVTAAKAAELAWVTEAVADLARQKRLDWLAERLTLESTAAAALAARIGERTAHALRGYLTL
ncbi:hypothetical protein [Chitinolyticbacter meiyuanensis]|uniref:hypothetical protein n=1 Tax=Chitinolyticbacter meiyuanensis TaxID=682798 RepID=UPI0011E5FCFD|nr:hypothetical protein [Chitinolyticbacter meiyuanensis]